MNGFLPPVVFEIQANATQALASFSKVNGQLKTMEVQATKTGIAMSKMQKTMVLVNATAKATGIIFGAFAAIGIKEITNLEKSFATLGQTMSNFGISTAETRQRAQEVAESFEKLGFDAADSAQGLASLITATGDLDKSEKLLSISADLARRNNMSLSEASRVLARATQGNAKAFREFGVTLDTSKPKAQAVDEALEKLEKRIGGSALAYTKTFRGQVAVLHEQFMNLAETIGAYVLPVLKNFISGIQATGKFLAKYKEILIAIGLILTSIVIVAVVNLTKKLYLQAAAWAAANWQITLIIAGITALVAGFAWAWNKFDGVRKAVVWVLQGFIDYFRLVVLGVQYLIKGLALIPDWAGGNQAAFRKAEQSVGMFVEKIDEVYDKVGGLKDKKINISIKGLKIGDFGLGGGAGDTGGSAADKKANAIADALAKASQKIKDASAEIKKSFLGIKETYASVIGRDWKKAVEEGLLNPTEKIVRQAQESADAYVKASNAYANATNKQKQASNNLLAAIKSDNKAAILAAQSAYDSATKNVQDLQKVMESSIDNLASFQQEAIDAIVGYEQELADLNTQRTAATQKALNDQRELEANYNADVAAIRAENARNVLSATQEVEKRRAEILKSSVDQLRGVFRNATQASVGDLYKSLTFDGRYLAGGSAASLANVLKEKFQKASKLAEDASALAGMGFSQTFIEQVVSQGPELGHELAQSILGASPESVTELKKYWDGLEKVSQNGVDVVATTLNAGMNLATQEMRDELEAVNREFANTLANLAQEMLDSINEKKAKYDAATKSISDALKSELKIIDDQITATETRIEKLRAALASLGTLGSPGTAQGNVDLTPTPAVAATNEATQAALDAARAAEEASAAAEEAINNVDEFLTSIGINPNASTTTGTNDWAENQSWWRSGGYGSITDSAASASVVTTMPFTGSALAGYKKAELADITADKSVSTSTVNVTVNATTNASADAIASEVGWAIRTSSDMTYAVMPSGKKIPMGDM